MLADTILKLGDGENLFTTFTGLQFLEDFVTGN